VELESLFHKVSFGSVGFCSDSFSDLSSFQPTPKAYKMVIVMSIINKIASTIL
jgi:hypothetical protein